MRFACDGRLIAACCSDPDAVFVWEVDSGREVFRSDGRWYALAFSADGTWLALVGGRLPIVALCDIESGREILRSELSSEVFAVDVAKSNRTVVCGLSDGSVMALDVASVVA